MFWCCMHPKNMFHVWNACYPWFKCCVYLNIQLNHPLKQYHSETRINLSPVEPRFLGLHKLQVHGKRSEFIKPLLICWTPKSPKASPTQHPVIRAPSYATQYSTCYYYTQLLQHQHQLNLFSNHSSRKGRGAGGWQQFCRHETISLVIPLTKPHVCNFG